MLSRIVRSGITVVLVLLSYALSATTYTKSSGGDYSNSSGWSPSYPGTTISAGDTVIIDATVTLDVDIDDINGVLIINAGDELSGSKEIKEISSGGVLINNGSHTVKKIDKMKGTVYLYGDTEVTEEIKIEDNGVFNVEAGGSLESDKMEVKDNGQFNINGGTVEFTDEVKFKDDAVFQVTSGSFEADKLKLEDDVTVTNFGTMTINGNLEIKDDVSFTNRSTGSITVKNDLKLEDSADFDNDGTIYVEDDIKIEDDATLDSPGAINICDPDETEGESLLEIKDNAVLNVSGDICMCSSNPNNTIDNTSSNSGSFSVVNCTTSVVTTLPVELIYFDAFWLDGELVVEWTTASEIDNALFELELSYSGDDFKAIHNTPGAGNSNTAIDYWHSFVPETDERFIYLRIKTVDFDGNVEFSNVLTVEQEVKQSPEIKVYPTVLHAGDVLSIENARDDQQLIQLISLSGQIFEINREQNDYITIPDFLSQGVYVVWFENNESGTVNHKIIVQ